MIKYHILFLLTFHIVIIFQISLRAQPLDSLSKPLFFYGYDFSHTKFIDDKYSGEEVADMFKKNLTYLNKKFPPIKLAKLFKADTIEYRFYATEIVNAGISKDSLVSLKKYKISRDSIQSYINGYELTELSGTGIVIIFEKFEAKRDINSLFLIVFNIADRRIIRKEYISLDGYTYNDKLADWIYPSYSAITRVIRQLSWDEEKLKKDSVFMDTTYFRPTFFKNSKNELPFTFGINPVAGISTAVVSGGVHLNADIFHILIGYRTTVNPVFGLGKSTNDETAYYIGYRYRKQKYSISAGTGIGKIKIICTSGLSSDCYNFREETVTSIPVFFEYAYFFIPYAGITCSINGAFANRGSSVGLLCGLKVGISRKWRESRKYKN